MVYVGYPVNLEEALRLFNLTFDEKLESPYHYHSQCRKFIDSSIKKFGLNFYCADKNLHIIGIDAKELLGNCWSTHRTVDESLMILLQLKSEVVNGMKMAKVDMSRVEITHMEGEDTIVSNPEPYLINYSYN